MKKNAKNKKDKLKKLKKFYKENRIFSILMIVSIFCVIVIGTSLIVYFIKQSGSSNYGSRLEDISKYDTKEDVKKLSEYYKKQELVEKYDINIQGKIIYINVTVKSDVTKEQVENLGVEALDLISEDNFEYYDIQFMFKRKNYDTYFGSCAAQNTIISWVHTFDVTPNDGSTTTTTTTTKKK